MKRLFKPLFVLLVVASILATAVPASAETYDYTYSKYFERTSIASPLTALPGDTIELHLKSGVSIQELDIVSVLHGPYKLEILSNDNGVLKAKVPEGVAPDDYFLLAKTGDKTVVVPNGLAVFKKWPSVLAIAQVSDTHVTSGAQIGYVCGDYFQRDIYKLETMCNNPIPLHSEVATDSAYTYWAMNTSATLIMHTGDDVDTSGDYAGYNAMFDIMSRAAAAGKPLVTIKGNHDDPPTVYAKIIGPRYFYTTIGKFLIIGLDTGGDQGYPTMDEITWMEGVLNEHSGYTTVILIHHPYFFAPSWNYLGGVIKGLSPFNDNDWGQLKSYLRYWGKNEAVARRFLEDVVKYNVPLILAGHIHHDSQFTYIDDKGHVHRFLTLTATGSPAKESNPTSRPGYSPTWYGSNFVLLYLNGTVKEPYVNVTFNGDKIKSDFMSIPIPQRFIVLRSRGKDGTAIKFINELGRAVSGPVTLKIPAGAKVDPSVTNITYKVLGEREIGGINYLLVNATVPTGISQIVVSSGSDTQKPTVQIAYTSPAKVMPDSNFVLYFMAQDNIGMRDLYVQVLDENGNPVKYGKVDRFPAEPTSGKIDNQYYTVNLPALSKGKYTIKVVAVDFYGNKAEVTKEINVGATQTPSTSSTSSQTSGKSVCGPAALIALAVLPLLARKRK